MATPAAQRAERVTSDWRSRRFAALGVRLVVIAVPVLCGSGAARLVLHALGRGHSPWLTNGVALAVAVLTCLVVGRLSARLLPLAVLLKMTMIFPDRAPSRLKVARRTTSRDELLRRLQQPDTDLRESATTLLALVTALGRHDRHTRGHSERVRVFCDLIGTQLKLSDDDRGRLRWVGLLHDIGKLEVASAVLNKPDKLDDRELAAVRAHPVGGAELARPLADWLGPWFPGIGHHHERFDGTGYPEGLSGEHISEAGRIVAVVDAFETMTAARSYKSPMTTAAARAELASCAGTHFDPRIVRAFLAIALPRLLWAMGPLTFLTNMPFLRWIPSATTRAASVTSAGSAAATNAIGITAVSVAVATTQTALHAHQQDRALQVATVSSTGRAGHSTAGHAKHGSANRSAVNHSAANHDATDQNTADHASPGRPPQAHGGSPAALPGATGTTSATTPPGSAAPTAPGAPSSADPGPPLSATTATPTPPAGPPTATPGAPTKTAPAPPAKATPPAKKAAPTPPAKAAPPPPAKKTAPTPPAKAAPPPPAKKTAPTPPAKAAPPPPAKKAVPTPPAKAAPPPPAKKAPPK